MSASSEPLETEVVRLRATVQSLADTCAELIPMALLGAAYLSSNNADPNDTILRLRRILLEIGDTQPQVAELIESCLRERGCPIDEKNEGVAP